MVSDGASRSVGRGPASSASPDKSSSAWPCQSLLPLFVTTFSTPPVEPPYSALYPDDLTCTSSTKSVARYWPGVPSQVSVVSIPSIITRFSAPVDPSMAMPPAFRSSFAPGA